MTTIIDKDLYSSIVNLQDQAKKAQVEYESKLTSSGLYTAATKLSDRYKELTGLRTGSHVKEIYLTTNRIGIGTSYDIQEPGCTYHHIPARFLWEAGWEDEIANINSIASEKLRRLISAAKELNLNYDLESSILYWISSSDLESVLTGCGLPDYCSRTERTRTSKAHWLIQIIYDTERDFQSALNQKLSSLGISNTLQS